MYPYITIRTLYIHVQGRKIHFILCIIPQMLIIPARALAIFHLYQQGCVRVEFQTEYRLPRLSYLHKKDNAVHFNLNPFPTKAKCNIPII